MVNHRGATLTPEAITTWDTTLRRYARKVFGGGCGYLDVEDLRQDGWVALLAAMRDGKVIAKRFVYARMVDTHRHVVGRKDVRPRPTILSLDVLRQGGFDL